MRAQQQAPCCDNIARLRVEIEEVEPAVIRRLEVPLDTKLDKLNVILQVAIGWQNCHPFEFRHGETVYGLVSSQTADNPLPAEKATLADLAKASARPSTTTMCSATTGSTR